MTVSEEQLVIFKNLKVSCEVIAYGTKKMP
jgi:hypothetical protein